MFEGSQLRDWERPASRSSGAVKPPGGSALGSDAVPCGHFRPEEAPDAILGALPHAHS
jgi:hypothetical protein